MRATLMIALAVVTLAACHERTARRDPLPPGEAAQLLAERLWLDHPPRTQRDRFNLAIFDESGVAVAQHRSVWKGEFEAFKFKVRGDTLELALPHSNKRITTHFRIVRVDDRHADLKLILDQNPLGPREYLGFKGEDHGAITPASADAWLRARVDQRASASDQE